MRDCKTCVNYGYCTADDMASCAHGDNIGHSDYRPKTSEYIKREDAIKSLLTDVPEQVGYSRENAIDCIKFIDAADVAPVRHGRWMFGGDGLVECSVCNETYDVNMLPRNYCPNCGAKCNLED